MLTADSEVPGLRLPEPLRLLHHRHPVRGVPTGAEQALVPAEDPLLGPHHRHQAARVLRASDLLTLRRAQGGHEQASDPRLRLQVLHVPEQEHPSLADLPVRRQVEEVHGVLRGDPV